MKGTHLEIGNPTGEVLLGAAVHAAIFAILAEMDVQELEPVARTQKQVPGRGSVIENIIYCVPHGAPRPTPGAGPCGVCRSMQRTRGLTLRGMCEGRTAGPGSGSAARSVLPEAAAGQRVGAHIFVYFRMRTTIRSSEIRRVVIRSYTSTVWGSGGIIHQEVASEAEQASSAERITRPGRCSRRRCRASLVLVPRKS